MSVLGYLGSTVMRSSTWGIQMHRIWQINQDYLEDFESKRKLKYILPFKFFISAHAFKLLQNHTNQDKKNRINSRMNFISETGILITYHQIPSFTVLLVKIPYITQISPTQSLILILIIKQRTVSHVYFC